MYNLFSTELTVKYRKAKERLILLDYDGTLVSYTAVPESAELPGHLSEILLKLSSQPNTKLFIITGRGYKDIDRFVDHLPLNIIADHGGMIKENQSWKKQVKDDGLWKKSILPFMEKFTLSCPGTYIEEKTLSLAWHYRNADPGSGFLSSRELIKALTTAVSSQMLKILDGLKVVEVMNVETGKGEAVKKLVSNFEYDFILSVGDDVSDEEMFGSLLNNSSAITIKVGSGSTFAIHRLEGTSDVESILLKLSE